MTSNRRYRRHIRLPEYDYRLPGYYFITVCTAQRRFTLGTITDGVVLLSAAGRTVNDAWVAIPVHHPGTVLDEMIIMPNHVHGILAIQSDGFGMPARSIEDEPFHKGMRGRGPSKGSLGAIVGSFKSSSARTINRDRGTPAAPVWQQNYYEHVIRNEASLDRIRAYIAGNPARWQFDAENPHRLEDRDRLDILEL